MKVVHNSLREAATAQEWLNKAKGFEKAEEWQDAAAAYEKVIAIDPVNESAYNRLMIIYRKEKEWKKELAVVKKGIKAFEEYYASTSRRSHGKNVIRLSQALMRSMELADKKGRPFYK